MNSSSSTPNAGEHEYSTRELNPSVYPYNPSDHFSSTTELLESLMPLPQVAREFSFGLPNQATNFPVSEMNIDSQFSNSSHSNQDSNRMTDSAPQGLVSSPQEIKEPAQFSSIKKLIQAIQIIEDEEFHRSNDFLNFITDFVDADLIMQLQCKDPFFCNANQALILPELSSKITSLSMELVAQFPNFYSTLGEINSLEIYEDRYKHIKGAEIVKAYYTGLDSTITIPEELKYLYSQTNKINFKSYNILISKFIALELGKILGLNPGVKKGIPKQFTSVKENIPKQLEPVKQKKTTKKRKQSDSEYECESDSDNSFKSTARKKSKKEHIKLDRFMSQSRPRKKGKFVSKETVEIELKLEAAESKIVQLERIEAGLIENLLLEYQETARLRQELDFVKQCQSGDAQASVISHSQQSDTVVASHAQHNSYMHGFFARRNSIDLNASMAGKKERLQKTKSFDMD